ncbi:MAG TPA: TolC family protein, partial [Tepidisphaeraceae bacterium]
FDPALTGQVQAGKSDRAAGGGTTRRRDVIANTASAQASVQQFFPTGTTVAVDATADYNDFDFYSDTARLGLTVTQSLLRGAGADVNLAALREARIDTKLSQYELRGFAESLVAQVEETYWDYALSQRQIDIFTESLSLAGQQLDQTNELIRVGKLAETERAAAEAELATRREDLINARANLESTRLRLLRLLNPPGAAGADDGETSGNFWSRPIQLRNHPFIPADVLDDVENHADLALQMRPDLNQARLQVQRGDLEIVRTRNGLLPRMDLFVTLGKTGYSSSFGGAISDLKGKGYDAAVGLRFDLPITSRDAEAQFRRAVLTREQSTEAVNNAAQLVQVDVRTAYVEVQRTAQQIVATAATRRLQEVKLTTETEKFRIGKSTSLLVAQAQRDLVASQINEIEAVVSHLKALVELYRLEGSLLERRRIAAPGRDPIGLTNK